VTKKTFLERYAGNTVVVALITLLGVLLSALITHWMTKRTVLAEQEAQRSRGLETQRLEFKKQAYTDFLAGQTLLQQGPARRQEADQLIDSAKLRIILLGSDKVLCSMAQYWASRDRYTDCTDVAEKQRDAAIYRNMRKEFFQTLGAPETPEIHDRILVPYLRLCLMPGEKVEQMCDGL